MKRSFYDQIDRNKRASWILIVAVAVTLGFVTLAMAFIIGNVYDVGVMFLFLILATVFNIGYVLYTYYNSDKVALKAVNAYPADHRHQQLINIVEEMTLASGMPKPRIYVMPSQDINAFATGRDPAHSVVCVTEGAIAKLSRSELQGVIAHEMTHIRNYDIRFVTLVAVMVGLISIISQLFLRSLWFGGGRRRGGGNAALLVIGIVLAILAPLVVKLVQLAISRKREYMADAGGVELTRYPDGLIEALRKIKADYAEPRKHTKVNEAVAPMFLADPAKNRITSLFQTHPPIDDRIRALEAM